MSDNTHWEIIDDDGVIESSSDEDEIRGKYQAMKDGDQTAMPQDGIHGDLKLVEVHEVYR